MKFKLNEDMKIGGQIIRKGSVVEVQDTKRAGVSKKAFDYDKMTDADFDRILRDILRAMTGEQLLSISGIYEIVREEYNNDVLTEWENEQSYEDDEE